MSIELEDDAYLLSKDAEGLLLTFFGELTVGQVVKLGNKKVRILECDSYSNGITIARCEYVKEAISRGRWTKVWSLLTSFFIWVLIFT